MFSWFVDTLLHLFSSHLLHALLVYSISYLGQDCALRHFHKSDRIDPHMCCLGWYPNTYVMHVWESVWKASAAIAGFQQKFEQNLLLEQSSKQTKSRIRIYVEHYPPVPTFDVNINFQHTHLQNFARQDRKEQGK